MNYREALAWLYATQRFGIKLGLENTEGKQVEVGHNTPGLRWRQIPGFVQQAIAEG